MGLVVSLILALPLGEAHAEELPIPGGCSANVYRKRAYNGGYAPGVNLVNSAWNAIGNDCDRVEEFETIVINSLNGYKPDKSWSVYTLCRYSGRVSGMLDQLDVIYNTCQNQCLEEGELVGEISGIAYCELSIALGGLGSADEFIRGPVQLCGSSFEVGCDSRFLAVTTSYVNNKGVCVNYTRNPFEEIWRAVQTNQCAYNPEPPAQNAWLR